MAVAGPPPATPQHAPVVAQVQTMATQAQIPAETAQSIVNRVNNAAISPAVSVEMAKQGISAYKEVIEMMKAPSEIERNQAVSAYYNAGARLHDYHRSAEYVADQVMIHAAGPLATGIAHQQLELFKVEIEKKSAEELKGIKAPPILAKITGMSDMGDIAKYFGRNNLEKLLAIGEQMEYRLQIAATNRSNQDFQKDMANWEKLSKDVSIAEEKLRTSIPVDVWNKMTPQQQTEARLMGGAPRTKELADNLTLVKNMRDNLGKKLYGDRYIPTPITPPAPRDVTPAGGQPPKPGDKPGMDMSFRESTTNALVKALEKAWKWGTTDLKNMKSSNPVGEYEKQQLNQ